ncbi:MAG: UbiA family prenyltransferase [Spirochaetota bacterium]
MEENNKPVFKPIAFIRLMRLNRTIMVAMITGTGAFVSGSGAAMALRMALSGWLLAVGGFSLDFYADRDLDIKAPRILIRRNPLVNGSLSTAAGLTFSIMFISISFIAVVLTVPRALPFWFLILGVITGLALHLFETPLLRALTLGLLQALYILMGGSAGHFSPGLFIASAMFFFAMFGGRGMIDIRDFPQDTETPVQTFPKRYGVKRTALFTTGCLAVSYALSLAVYFTGEFTILYLYLDAIFIAVGVICTVLFAVKPSPSLARSLTLVFMMGLGTLICLALISGKIKI